ELVGVKNLAPDVVIAALRLPPDASVFTDTRLLGDRLRGLAGVAEVHVVRQLPAALRIELREVEPAALAPRGSGPRGGPLVAVDAEGRPLPFDPARTGLDLPVAAAADPGVGGRGGGGGREPGPTADRRARPWEHEDLRRDRRGRGRPAAPAARQGAGRRAREERRRAAWHGAGHRRDRSLGGRRAAGRRADG